jgi:hypothetical protein
MGTSVFATGGYNGVTVSDTDPCRTQTARPPGQQLVRLGGPKWRATTAFGGSWAIECHNASGQAANLRLPFDARRNVVSLAVRLRLPGLPGSGAAWETIATVRAGSTVQIIAQIDTGGKLALFAGGTQLPNSTAPGGGAPTALTPGSKYRLELTVAGSSTVATGTVSGRIFAYAEPTTTNYICGTTSSSAATGTTAFTHCDVGLGSHATVFTLTYSNVRLVSGRRPGWARTPRQRRASTSRTW